MGGVEHLVVLFSRPLRILQERPRVVEQSDGERTPGGLVEVGGDGGSTHDGFSLRQLGHVMQDALEPVGARLDPCPMGREATGTLRRVVGSKNLADLVERQLELAQSGDRAGGLELIPPVATIATGTIDLGRPEQVELVVVTKGADTQPGEPGEPTDRQQFVVHGAIVNPSVGRESSPSVRRFRARGRSPGG